MSNTAVRGLYRQFLLQVRGLPGRESTAALQELRSSFRQPLQEGKSVEELLEKGKSRLGFLRMRTPILRRKATNIRLGFKDGKELQGEELAKVQMQYYKDKRLDPDDLRRHEHLLRRQHFMDR